MIVNLSFTGKAVQLYKMYDWAVGLAVVARYVTEHSDAVTPVRNLFFYEIKPSEALLPPSEGCWEMLVGQ